MIKKTQRNFRIQENKETNQSSISWILCILRILFSNINQILIHMNIFKKLFKSQRWIPWNNRYFNLSNNIFYIGKLGRINYNGIEYSFGFSVVLSNGAKVVLYQNNNCNEVPREIEEVRELFIHNLGFSFVELDEKYKNIQIKLYNYE